MTQAPALTNKDLLKQDAARAEAIRASGLRLDYDTILHIGRHKAGTTALQNNLHHNADALAAQGFCYPQLFEGKGHIAHHALSEMFQRRRPEVAVNRAITAGLNLAERLESQVFERLILSSENFQNIRPEQLELVFDPARTTVVVYIREQYAYAQSSYSQAVHARKITDSFPAYLKRFKTFYNLFLTAWVKSFAPRDLIVRVYARDALLNGDIVEDFCETVGVSMAAFQRHDEHSNPSIGGPVLTFKRWINTLPISESDLAATYTPLAQLAEANPAFRAKPFVPVEEAEAYRAQFVDGNEIVARRFFDRTTLFDIKPPKPVPEQDDIGAIDEILEGISNARHGGRILTALNAALQADGAQISPYLAELKRRV